MLNKDLYDCLIELGANQEKAERAAEENAKLDAIQKDIATFRHNQFEIHRQTSEVNDRVIRLEAAADDDKRWRAFTDNRLAVMHDKMKSVDGRLVGIESDIRDFKSCMGSMEEMLKTLVDKR